MRRIRDDFKKFVRDPDYVPESRLSLLVIAAAQFVVGAPIVMLRYAGMLIVGPRRWRNIEEKIERSGGSTN